MIETTYFFEKKTRPDTQLPKSRARWQGLWKKKANQVDDDQELVKSLLNDLDIPFDAHSDTLGHFRVGRLNSERPRPIVIKLTHANKK